jgi:hypothetical protein
VLNLRFPGPVSCSRGLKDFNLDHLTLIFLPFYFFQILFGSAIGGTSRFNRYYRELSKFRQGAEARAETRHSHCFSNFSIFSSSRPNW